MTRFSVSAFKNNDSNGLSTNRLCVLYKQKMDRLVPAKTSYILRTGY